MAYDYARISQIAIGWIYSYSTDARYRIKRRMDLIQYRVVMVIEQGRIAAYPKGASITIARYNTMYKANIPSAHTNLVLPSPTRGDQKGRKKSVRSFQHLSCKGQ